MPAAEVDGWVEVAVSEAPRDSKGDGIPDDWLTANGFDPQGTSVANEVASSGYTLIEEYLNSLVLR